MSTTATSTTVIDPEFDAPYIDVNEWRDAPVRHRYVHGGFENTETRFSFYLRPMRSMTAASSSWPIHGPATRTSPSTAS